MSSGNHYDVIVVGGGIAGVSVAYELSKDSRVLLFEAETQLGYHSTGRSAAVYIPSYGHEKPALFELTRSSYEILSGTAGIAGWQGFLYPRDLLRITDDCHIEQLRDDYEALRLRLSHIDWIDKSAIHKTVPLLRNKYSSAGILEPNVFDIDVSALQDAYLRAFKVNGGQIQCNSPVQKLRRNSGIWKIRGDGRDYSAPVVVNACGAWADELATLAGVKTQMLKPLRRTAILVQIDTPSLSDWPVVMDAVQGCYFKPDAGLLLASPGDETLSPACDSAPEEIDKAYAAHYLEERFDVKVREIRSAWSGLRTFSPDRSPVIGFSEHSEGFFWLAGQGGHGIQTAPAASQLAARMINSGDIPEALVQAGFDPLWVKPDRFEATKDTADA